MTYQNAVVTGGSRGIGAAIVRRLRGRGMEVHALARPSDDLTAIATETGAIAHPMDITATSDLSTLIHRIQPDVLVNNAGVLPQLTEFPALAPDTIDQSIDVNLRAALHATRAALGPMTAAGHGHIFLVGSIAGRIPSPHLAVYSATKAALHMFGDVLRLDLLGTGIRVTTVLPGRVETNIYDEALGGHEAAEATLYVGAEAVQPDDVARAVTAALDMPPNVDTTLVELLPTRQAYGGNQLARDDG